VKVAKSLAAREAFPTLLQFTARRSSEIRIHFRLSQILEYRHSDFFEVLDDLQFELLILRDGLRGFSRPAQRTAVEGMNGASAQVGCGSRCLRVPKLRQSRIAAGFIPLPVRFPVPD
jgi:hypothetical protein